MGLPETFTNDEECDRTFVKQREMPVLTETPYVSPGFPENEDVSPGIAKNQDVSPGIPQSQAVVDEPTGSSGEALSQQSLESFEMSSVSSWDPGNPFVY